MLPKQLNILIAPVTVQNRRWRALARIVYVSQHESDGFMVVIPAWGPVGIPVSWDRVTDELRPEIKVDARFHCLCCLGADTWEGVKPFICER